MRVLVAGIGNIFLGDDGFGPAVAQRLLRRSLPDGVRVVDFGIRGFDLTCALLEDWDAAVLIDAAQRGGAPGTLYLVEPAPDDGAPQTRPEATLDPHALEPAKVLSLVRSMGGQLGCLRLIGCEPESLEPIEESASGLSPVVEAAVDPAVAMVEKLIGDLPARRAHA
jgi:hydrogenase maturation protease